MDKVNLFDVRKECRVCGRKYSALDTRVTCDCGRYLYLMGAYWQRPVMGGDFIGKDKEAGYEAERL